jgi:hypothetical protein
VNSPTDTPRVTLVVQAGRQGAVVVVTRVAGQGTSEQIVQDAGYTDPTGLLVLQRAGSGWTVQHVAWPHGTLTIATDDMPVRIDADDQSITYTRV